MPAFGKALCVAALALAASAAASHEPDLAELDAAVERLMAEHGIPGAVLALVETGKPPILRGYGFAHVDRQEAMDPHGTLLHQGSTVKVVTAILVMRLAEAGLVDLDSPVESLLTPIPLPHGGGAPVSLAHLLANAAGLEQQGIGTGERDEAGFQSLERYLARRRPMQVAPPAEVLVYSSVGFALAGLAAERAAATPFHRLVDREVFQPLGMTTSLVPIPPHYPDELATGYRAVGDRLAVYRHHYYSLLAPGGDFVASAADMARLLESQLPGPLAEGQLHYFLTPAGVARMQQRHFSPDPRLRGHALGWAEWWVDGRRALYHDGGAPGFLVRLFLAPEHGKGFYVGVNSAYSTRFLREVTEDILQFWMPPLEAEHSLPVLPVLPAPAPDLKEFCGTYRGFGTARSGVGKIHMLFDTLEVHCEPGQGLRVGRGGRLLRWQGEDGFGTDDGTAFIRFRRDSEGRVTHLQRGGTGTFETIPWYDSPRLHFLLFVAVVVLLAGAVVVGVVPRWRRKQRLAGISALAAGIQLVGVLGLAAYVGYVLSVDPWWSLIYGPPAPMRVLLVLPWFALALAAVLALALLRNLRPQGVSRLGLARTVILGVASSFAWLGYWNLA